MKSPPAGGRDDAMKYCSSAPLTTGNQKAIKQLLKPILNKKEIVCLINKKLIPFSGIA